MGALGDLCGRDLDCSGDLVCNTHHACEPLGGVESGPFEAAGFLSVEPRTAAIFPAQPFELRVHQYDVHGAERGKLDVTVREPEFGVVRGMDVIAERLGTLHVDADLAGRSLEVASLDAVDAPVDLETPLELELSPRAAEMPVDAVVPLQTRAYARGGNRVTPELRFESSDPAVATVTGSGLVVALAPGYALIAVSVRSQPNLRATFGAVVRDQNSKLVAFNPCVNGPFAANCSLFLSRGQLHAVVDRACPRTFLTTTYGVWSSSAPEVVSVDEAGVVTRLSAGSATISFQPELPLPDLTRRALCELVF